MKADDVSVLNITSLIVGMGLGAYIGYLYKRNYPIRINRAKGLIYLPTDKSLLVMMLLTFGVELFMSLTENLRPSPYWWFNPMAMVISGVITGIVAGGNMMHYYRYLHNEAEPIP
ncbi:MAG: hypothetical protein K0R66_1354 [Gammaproteobacteria bacterium]|jgi:hypothetical protein|nr:hypothetical protein [Gammaproteobacteria bacterium]